LGLNLRLEAPLLNVKLRKLKKKKKILIFSFSNTANLLYYVKHVSISSKNFIKFLEGKHYLSNFLVNNKSKSYFLLGSSLLRRSDAQAYIYSLEYFINNQFPNASFGIIQNYIGRVTSAEIGLVPGISYYNNNNSLQFNNFNNLFKKPINNLFIFAADDYKKLNLHKYNSFNIFIGPQTENYIDNVHMVLPSTNHFEKTTSYLNIEGISRFSQTVIKLLENVQED
jgi:NADH dehydrogenase/NADH:ubiquinone oxidoreductase subunit G